MRSCVDLHVVIGFRKETVCVVDDDEDAEIHSQDADND